MPVPTKDNPTPDAGEMWSEMMMMMMRILLRANGQHLWGRAVHRQTEQPNATRCTPHDEEDEEKFKWPNKSWNGLIETKRVRKSSEDT